MRVKITTLIFISFLPAIVIAASSNNQFELEKYQWLESHLKNHVITQNNKVLGLTDITHRKVNKLTLPTSQIFQNQVNYQEVDFESKVNFSLIQFTKTANFTLSTFHDMADFSNTQFQKTKFDWSLFKKPVSFSYANFNDDISFYNVYFLGNVTFYGARFHSQSNFHAIRASKRVDFSEVRFMKKSDLSQSHFTDHANFQKTEFDGGADFSNTVFKSKTNFTNANLKGKVSFQGVEFHDTIDFENSLLPLFLDFSNVNIIKDQIDLSTMKLRPNYPKCRINLVNAEIEKFDFRYQYFQLYFPPKTPDYKVESTYKKLLNNFQKKGYTKSYQSLFIEHKQYLYAKNNQWIRNAIQKYWWNYGFDKQRVFLWLLVILLVLSTINTFLYEKLYTEYCRITFLNKPLRSYKIKKNPFLKFVFYFPYGFLFTVFFFFGYFLSFSRRQDEIITTNIFFLVYLFSTIVIGLIFALFILNFAIGM